MDIQSIRTRVFSLAEDLAAFIVESIPREAVREKAILAVTSKVVSLAEGRLVSPAKIEKSELIRREADMFLGELAHRSLLTIKHGLLINSAGIDESNSPTGDYILYPEHPFVSAERLWKKLRSVWELNELGILITDSRTSPLRRGVTGISLAHWGFRAIRPLVGKPDLFGRKLKSTNVNLADSLAAAAVLAMGEADECTPLAVITGARLEFCSENSLEEVSLYPRDDLYAPLYLRKL